MKKTTLNHLISAGRYNSILRLKVDLLRHRNDGTIFFMEPIDSLLLDEPFEIYYHKTNGEIQYDNAFPIPIKHYVPWKLHDVNYLIEYYQTYYVTQQIPETNYFKTLSRFNAKYFIWFYKER